MFNYQTRDDLPVPGQLLIGKDLYLLSTAISNQTNRNMGCFHIGQSVHVDWELTYFCRSRDVPQLVIKGDRATVEAMLEAFRD